MVARSVTNHEFSDLNSFCFVYCRLCFRTGQYGIEEVEIATAVVDLEDIRSYRNLIR